jgi:hypothetical protein
MSSFQNIVLNKRLTLIQHICQDPRPVQGRNDPMEILTINIEPGASGNNEQGEPAATYRWPGWVWEITGWSSKLQENYQSFLEELIRFFNYIQN